MLKIPNVSAKLNSFKFSTIINENGEIELTITFSKQNKSGSNVSKTQNYIISTDIRCNNINDIKSTIDRCLNNAQGPNTVILRYDKNRNYIWLDGNQFTGRKI